MVQATDVSDFSDGFGIGSGDSIVIGVSRVTIAAIDYVANSISIDRAISWSKNDPVSFPFSGAAPTMGASYLP